MSTPTHMAKARELRRLAAELETAADAMEQPSRTTHRSDALIDRVEDIAAQARAVVRGRAVAGPLAPGR
jgi:hypothetical protein